MTTYTLAGAFGWAGGGKSGAIVDIWATSRFTGIPAQNQAPPSGSPDAGPVTTGENFGSPGAYEITNIATLQDYYVRVQYGGNTYWGLRTAGSLGGVGGGTDVLSVFGRTGNVIAQSGDYTAAQVGADTAGAAAGVLASSLQKINNLSDLNNAGTARTNLGLGTAATQASTAFDAAGSAAAAEAAAKAASLPLTGGTMSGAIAMGSNKVTGLANGSASTDAAAFGQLSPLAPINNPTFTGTTTAPEFSASGLTGATAASRYVGATASGAPASGTFAIGDVVVDQSGAIWVCTVAGTPGTWVNTAGSGLTGNPSGLMYAASAQTVVSSGVGTQITTLTAFSGSLKGGVTVGSNALVVPTTGIYKISWQIRWQASGGGVTNAGDYGAIVFQNGTEILSTEIYGIATGNPAPNSSVDYPLSANDSLALWGFQNSGSPEGSAYAGQIAAGLATWLSVSLVSK